MNKRVRHIVKEGSREHVTHWDTNGAHCSEPNCEMNKEMSLTDGFGNYWAPICPDCGGKMQVVRPGKVQCSECG